MTTFADTIEKFLSANHRIQSKDIASSIFYNNESLMIIRSLPIPNLENLEIEKSEKVFENSRFKKYRAMVKTELEVTIVDPVQQVELDKYSKKNKIMTETPEIYYDITLPKIINQDLTWINNILEGKSEMNSIVYNDEDFVLLPDLKWDKRDMDALYYLAIVRDKTIKSIRDLTYKHINLLEKIRDIGCGIIKNIHNIKQDELRIYVHYHPSYWHFHIHFNLINKHHNGAIIDFSHSLNHVIQNIKLIPNYYQLINLDVSLAIE